MITSAIYLLKAVLPASVVGVFAALNSWRGNCSPVMAEGNPEIPEELRPEYEKGVYNCKWKKFVRPGFVALGKWKSGYLKDHSNIPKSTKELDELLPIKHVELPTNPPEKLQVTWIGHATLLVQFDGITILTDPVFETFCGPQFPIISKFGYRRYRSAACNINDLKHLDAVIVSHNHFDHLESTAVAKICEKFPDATWFVAKGTTQWFSSYTVNIKELTWWEESTINVKDRELTFACLPAQHWCQRGVMDMNKSLWCSWAIICGETKFFFAGDTGYYEQLFKTIGEQYGPFTLAAIPIGAYEPRQLLEYQHVNPEEAVKIHKDIKSKQSIGIHWGTFPLSNEYYLEPPHKVKTEMERSGCSVTDFVSLCHGETWVVGTQREESPFMEHDCPEFLY